mgnify:CR=1 FL=1
MINRINGSDYEHVKRVIESVLAQDARVLNEPAPFIALSALADSSVNVVVRVWVKSSAVLVRDTNSLNMLVKKIKSVKGVKTVDRLNS